MSPRERGRRFLRAGRDIADVQPAVAVKDDSGVEIVQRERADMNARSAGSGPEIDALGTEQAPAHETVVGQLIDKPHAADRGIATVAEPHRLALLSRLDRAINCKQGAGNLRVEMAGNVLVKWRQVEPPRDDAQIGLEWIGCRITGNFEAACAIEHAVKVDRDWL